MGRIFLFVLLILIFGSKLYSQHNSDVIQGIHLNSVYTGSGHGSAFVLNTNLRKGRKSLGFGLIYNPIDHRISGVNTKYIIYIGKNTSLDNYDGKMHVTLAKPYIHYSFIYHSKLVNSNCNNSVSIREFPKLPSSSGTIASMEHFLGMGVEVGIIKNLHFDGNIGIGTYIGSVNEVNKPETIGIHKENHGFVIEFEFGLGYTFI